MIRSDKGIIVIKGSKGDVFSDFAVVVRSLKSVLIEGGMSFDKAEAFIRDVVKIGLQDDEDDECCGGYGKDAVDEAVDGLFDAILHNAQKKE